MTKKLGRTLLVIGATIYAGDGFAHRQHYRPIDYYAGGYAAYLEREAQSYEYFLGCDFLRALAKYGDEERARLACNGLLFY